MRDRLPVIYAVLAFMQTITAGTGLAGIIGFRPAAFIALIVAGFQSGVTAFHIAMLQTEKR